MSIGRLALRGLTRNRRRSLATLLAIAFGFAALSLFAGYTRNVYNGLQRQAIYGELLGHLTIEHRGLRTLGKLDPERYLLSGTDVARIAALVQSEPHVKLVAPRLGISGLASNGRASTIFIADGISPQAMDALQRNALTPEQLRSGRYAAVIKKLDPAHPDTVLLSQGLADMLDLKKGDTFALLTNTVSGQANALDATVGGTFNTGNAGTNDKFVFMPLALAQSLYDSRGGADRLTVLLDDAGRTATVRARLLARLRAAGYDVEIESWRDLSAFYNQVHQMFDMIFGFIFCIVLTVVVMSVANSMGMTVVERTREIGTLRAIGLKRGGVVRLFALESLLLSLCGVAAGLALALAVRYGVNAADISYVPPNGAGAVPLQVDWDGARIAFAAAMLLAVGVLAAYFPARRAARQPVIDALGHV